MVLAQGCCSQDVSPGLPPSSEGSPGLGGSASQVSHSRAQQTDTSSCQVSVPFLMPLLGAVWISLQQAASFFRASDPGESRVEAAALSVTWLWKHHTVISQVLLATQASAVLCEGVETA